MKKYIVIAAIALVGIASAFIILGNEGYNPFTGDERVSYSESKEIHLPMEKLRTLNPVTSKDADTYQISKLIFESLFTFDDTLTPVNQLAASYVYDANKLTAEITIKNNSYFSDGTNVTAEDVKYSIENYMAAGNNSVYSSYVSNIKKVSLDKENNYKLTVKFKNGLNVSEDNFTFPIISKKNFGKHTAAKVLSPSFIPVGSGPYAIQSYNEISDLVLTANEYYSGVKPENTLVFDILPEKEDIIPLLDVSNMSMGIINDLSRDTLVADKNVSTQNIISNEVEVIGFNFRKEYMQNAKLRKAIAYSLDNESLLETAYYKNVVLCDSILYPGYLGTENKGEQYKYDLDKAKETFVSANYLDRNEDGYLDDVNEKTLELTILVNSQDLNRSLVAKSLKDNLDKLKIYSTIIYANGAEEFSYKLAEAKYDIFIGGLKINEKYDLRNVLHTDYGNIIKYSNPKLDNIMDKMKSGVSLEIQKELVIDMKDILIEELPYYPIGYKTYGALLSEAFCGNEKGYMFNNYYKNCMDWYCQYKIQENEENEQFEVVDSLEAL